MKKKLMLFAVSLLAAFPAGPGMADGINSGPGVTLPIGAGGSTHMWVNPSGNVYVGTATGTVPTAYAKLDVQGEVKTGKSIEPCNHLYNEGAIRYDKSTHSMLYCDQNDKWVPVGKNSFGGMYTANDDAIGTVNYCRRKNPFTGDCSCAIGYNSYPVADDSAYTTAGVTAYGTHLGEGGGGYTASTTYLCLPN